MRPRLLRAASALSCMLLLTVACSAAPSGEPAAESAATPGTGPPDARRAADVTRQAGPTGDVGPVARSCSGVTLSPGDPLHDIMQARPAGSTYCFTAGTYRLRRPLRPQQGDALIGLPGAVLNGSLVLRGWRSEGTTWWTRGDLPRAPSTRGECRPDHPWCTRAEDVYVDGRLLRRVGRADAVTPGTFHTDYGTGRVTIGTDPAGRLVEQAVAPALVRSTADGVTVANLVLEQAANEAQVGAVEARRVAPRPQAGTGWDIRHNLVRRNHGVGIGFGGRSTVVGNLVHHQGQLGFGAWGRGSVFRDNEVAHNGVAGYAAGWEAGGGKMWRTTGLRVAHNAVHHNRGPGLWTDGGNIHTRYARNRIAHNWGAGIQHEISYDARILANVVVGNGIRHKGWAWEAGIQIQSSGGRRLIEVADNVVTDNANGITLLDSGSRRWEEPAPHGPHVVRNVWVHHNTVTMRSGQATGAVEDLDDPAIFTTGRNRFDRNTYHLESLSMPHFLWAGHDLSWDRWHRLNGRTDPNGRAFLLPPG